MKLKDVINKKYQSNKVASTDIHNGGSLFGVIYRRTLEFKPKGIVSFYNQIEHNLAPWGKEIEKEFWSGTYKVNKEGKHNHGGFI